MLLHICFSSSVFCARCLEFLFHAWVGIFCWLKLHFWVIFTPLSLHTCSVYADGSICLDILQNQWSPIYDVAAILTSIQVCWCVTSHPISATVLESHAISLSILAFFLICSHCSVIQIPTHQPIQKPHDCLVRTSVSTTGRFVRLLSKAGQQTKLSDRCSEQCSRFSR